jgi:hypothetical protein
MGADVKALIPSGMRPRLVGVTRLILSILLAISMAGASGPAFAAPSADCPMAHMSQAMGHHDKMGCCPPECAVTCPAALLAAADVELPSIEPASMPGAMRIASVLPSVDPAAADPPPRS